MPCVCADACRVTGGCELPNMSAGVIPGLWKNSKSTQLLSHLSCPLCNIFPNFRENTANWICYTAKLSLKLREKYMYIKTLKQTHGYQVSTAEGNWKEYFTHKGPDVESSKEGARSVQSKCDILQNEGKILKLVQKHKWSQRAIICRKQCWRYLKTWTQVYLQSYRNKTSTALAQTHKSMRQKRRHRNMTTQPPNLWQRCQKYSLGKTMAQKL